MTKKLLKVGVVRHEVYFWGKRASGYTSSILLDLVLGRSIYLNNKTGEIQSGIFKTITTPDSGKTWILELVPNQAFHNGRDLTIQDMEFSFGHILSCPYGTPDQRMIENIQGSEKIQKNGKYKIGSLTGIQILDSLTMKVSLKKPDPMWIDFLAHSTFSPVPFEEQNASGNFLNADARNCAAHMAWKNFPQGVGPYKIVKGNSQEVWLEKFNECKIAAASFKNQPEQIYLKGCDLSNYKDFDLIVGINMPSEFSNSFEEVSTNLTECLMGLYFKYDLPLVRDDDFRKAVSLALNPDEFCLEDSSIQKTFTMIPQQFYKSQFCFEKPKFDPDLAKTIFKSLLKKYKFEDLYIIRPSIEIPTWHKTVIQQLQKAGLPISIKVDSESDFDPKDQSVPFLLTGYIPSFSRALPIFQGFQEGIGWVSELNNRDCLYNSLLKEGFLASRNQEDQFVQKLQERFLEKHYAIPLFETKLRFFVNSKIVKTVQPEKQSLDPRLDLIQMH